MDNHFLEKCLNLGPFLEKINYEGGKLAFCIHFFFLIRLYRKQFCQEFAFDITNQEKNGVKIGGHTIFPLSR